MNRQNPLWQEEEKHFTDTLKIIKREIKTIEEETGVGAKEEKRIVIPNDLAIHEWVAMDIMKGKIATLHQLSMAEERPYFARLDFSSNKKTVQSYYVGRWGVMDSEKLEVAVVDWRSPAANLYYSGQIGQVSYQAPDGQVEGELHLKRMFTLSNGALETISDTGIIGQEEYLQKALSQISTNRLKDVVTTIQAEQNIVIRYSPFMPLMVQGVAGSGKTTIALHRIAWLLYAYQENLKPRQMMIIAPNPLFLDYISQVLPDLGVEEVHQTTFEDLCRFWLKGKLPNIQRNPRLEERIKLGEAAYAPREEVLEQKGSLAFLKEVQFFLHRWEKELCPQKDLFFGQQLLFSKEEMNNILFVQLKPFPWADKVKEFKKMYQGRLDKIANKMTLWLRKRTDEKLERLLKMEEGEERQEKVQKLLASREVRITEVEEEKERLLKAFDQLWPNFDLVLLYGQFIQSLYNKEEYQGVVEQTHKALEEKKLYIEDLPPIVEIGKKVIAFPTMDIRHVVIDEAQDFSPFMLNLLQGYTGNDSFTLVGDVMQGIHGAQGISDWNRFKEENFHHQGEICYLATSYRSTVEIMEVAQRVLYNGGLMEKQLFQPVLRHGNPVNVVKTADEKDLSGVEKTIEEWTKKGYRNIAIICPTLEEGKKTHRKLSKTFTVTLLDHQERFYGGGLCVLSLAMAKGLEFDGVILPNVNKSHYPKESFYGKLLYVACTRALHELRIFYSGEESPLLAQRERDEPIL